MAIGFNTALAADFAGIYTTSIPASSLLIGYDGAVPDKNAAASGTAVFSIILPGTPWTASTNQVAKNNTWSVAAANGGTVTYYRLVNAGTTKWEQGTITAAGGGGDAIIDNTTVVAGQTVTCTTFTRAF